jgi:hypothetical protein
VVTTRNDIYTSILSYDLSWSAAPAGQPSACAQFSTSRRQPYSWSRSDTCSSYRIRCRCRPRRNPPGPSSLWAHRLSAHASHGTRTLTAGPRDDRDTNVESISDRRIEEINGRYSARNVKALLRAQSRDRAYPAIVNCASVGPAVPPPGAGPVQFMPPGQPPVVHSPVEEQPVRPQMRPLYPTRRLTCALAAGSSEKPPVLPMPSDTAG